MKVKDLEIYGDAAHRFGIRHMFRRYPRTVHFIYSPLSKRSIVDRHIEEAISLYFKQKGEKPEIKRKITSEIEI